MITSLEHIGLSVSDLERSVAFYKKYMNCKLIRIVEAGPDMLLGEVTGLSGCSARIAHLQSGNGMLELFEYTDPRGREISDNRCQADHGFIHAGFTSNDVRGDYKIMKDNGINFISPPVEFRPGVWICYFLGPDGEVCEIRQS
jgi:catechol 2,3-dioxygenase-like lactoylglutathione lyase family enzyme